MLLKSFLKKNIYLKANIIKKVWKKSSFDLMHQIEPLEVVLHGHGTSLCTNIVVEYLRNDKEFLYL